MCRCWEAKPEERPSFDEIHNDLKDIINETNSGNKPDYLQIVEAAG